MFYHFSQNNSGGSFDFDADAGITHHVIIEADSANEACELAEDIGLYFDGVQNGNDCPCCGDRWYAPWGDEGDAEPMVYSAPVETADVTFKWMGSNPEVYVHYKDGRIVGFLTEEKERN